MLKRILLSMAILLAAPLAAEAGDFNYNYVEGAYTSVNPSGRSSSLTGVTVDGSFAFDPHWHAIAGVEHVSGQNAFDVGAGWNTALADNVDVLIEGEFLSTDVAANTTNTGWGVNGGLRFQLAPMFELDGLVSHTDVNSVTENTLGVRGLFSIDKFWHVFASYANNSNADTFMIGVRYNF
jgi:hypothetical protein